MTPQDQLLYEYGELMYQFEHSHDWWEKKRLSRKMNAINILLDLPEVEHENILNIKEVLK